MKKSEFIEKVLQKVPEYTKLEVEQLLEVFEELGMLPVPYKTEFWNRMDNDYYYLNEWENEEKTT